MSFLVGEGDLEFAFLFDFGLGKELILDLFVVYLDIRPSVGPRSELSKLSEDESNLMFSS